jgi:hypothetical protein
LQFSSLMEKSAISSCLEALSGKKLDENCINFFLLFSF